MKKYYTVLFCLMLLLKLPTAFADTWYVHNYADGLAEGSLRVQLQSACEQTGDDTITFMLPAAPGPLRISLGSPLVIPRNCLGRIHLKGLESNETKIEMRFSDGDVAIPGSSCIFNVYSDGNILERLTLYGNIAGAGVCLFGRDNKISNDVFGSWDGHDFNANTYGVVMSDVFSSTDPGMDGSQNMVQDNQFLSNSLIGIYAHGSNNTILRNRIDHTEQMGIAYVGHNAQIAQNSIENADETGLLVQGNEVVLDHNTLRNNAGRGVVYEGRGGQLTATTIENSGMEGLLYRGSEGHIVSTTISGSHGDAVALEGDHITFEFNTLTYSWNNGIVGKIDDSILHDNHIEETQYLGVSLYGSHLQFNDNQVIHSHQDGVVLKGGGGAVYNNRVSSNGGSGFVLSGHSFSLYSNRILANGGCSSKQPFPSQKTPCFEVPHANGTGILLESGSHDMMIGGVDPALHANIIQYNHDGGVVLRGDAETIHNRITHNIISNNYGAEPDVDLLADGLTSNDLRDVDSGPNTLLNYAEYVQAFPLIPSPSGEARYWTWGISSSGNDVELYQVSDEDRARGRSHGGAHVFFGDSEVLGRTFRISPSSRFNSFEDQGITLLTSDEDNNTSEFSQNMDAGRDSDLDGIIDSREVREGSSRPGSRMDLTDTDGDGLPDSVEDRNRNGLWDRDLGETPAYDADSDHDGLSDWAETHGDGIYNPEAHDTNPFNADSDGDGLADGLEDRNNNGVWDSDLGESSPLLPDSDNDGIFDNRDNCPHIPNPAQEAWMCVRSSV